LVTNTAVSWAGKSFLEMTHSPTVHSTEISLLLAGPGQPRMRLIGNANPSPKNSECRTIMILHCQSLCASRFTVDPPLKIGLGCMTLPRLRQFEISPSIVFRLCPEAQAPRDSLSYAEPHDFTSSAVCARAIHNAIDNNRFDELEPTFQVSHSLIRRHSVVSSTNKNFNANSLRLSTEIHKKAVPGDHRFGGRCGVGLKGARMPRHPALSSAVLLLVEQCMI
jgi:hypothetical protein